MERVSYIDLSTLLFFDFKASSLRARRPNGEHGTSVLVIGISVHHLLAARCRGCARGFVDFEIKTIVLLQLLLTVFLQGDDLILEAALFYILKGKSFSHSRGLDCRGTFCVGDGLCESEVSAPEQHFLCHPTKMHVLPFVPQSGLS